MVGDHPHHLADLGLLGAGGEVEKAVLLRELGDARLGIFADQAVAVEPAGIGGECLRPGIENATLGAGAADHGGIDMQRAILQLGGITGEHHAIIEDIRAGPVLGRAPDLAEIGEIGRPSSRDDRGIKTQSAHAFEGLVEEGLRALHRILRIVEQEAGEFQRGMLLDPFSERHGIRHRLHAGALAAGIAFDHDLYGLAGFLPGQRVTIHRDGIVCSHDHPRRL